MKSIIQNDKRCYRCGSTNNLARHHCVFGTANRKKADQDGLWVWLCYDHHLGEHGVHTADPDYKRYLQYTAEKAWMRTYHKNKADFIERYSKSYENDS